MAKRATKWLLAPVAVLMVVAGLLGAWPHRATAAGSETKMFLPDDAQHETPPPFQTGAPDQPGDRLVTTGTLYDASSPSRQIGTLAGDGMIVDQTRFQSLFEMFLKDGSLMVYGISAFDRDNDMAVIGGTGKYRGARGTLTAHHGQLGGKDGTIFTLRLTDNR
jgi:hypothetical protein